MSTSSESAPPQAQDPDDRRGTEGSPAEGPTTASPPPPMDSRANVLQARGIRKSFDIGDRQLEILHGVNLELGRGELIALVGASGAGKSTLLHVLGLLDRPDEGSLHIDGCDAWNQSIQKRAGLRNEKIGFVFQMYHLLPELTAIENVMLPAMISESRLSFGSRRREHLERAMEMLERFGLTDRMKHRPAQLSGGERQRVAMARALYQDPKILLADEPTGNLDSATGERVLELLFQEQSRRELSMILVTHDLRLARLCERVLVMEDGQIQSDSTVPIPT